MNLDTTEMAIVANFLEPKQAAEETIEEVLLNHIAWCEQTGKDPGNISNKLIETASASDPTKAHTTLQKLTASYKAGYVWAWPWSGTGRPKIKVRIPRYITIKERKKYSISLLKKVFFTIGHIHGRHDMFRSKAKQDIKRAADEG